MNAAELMSAVDKLIYECHQNAVLHGFYDDHDNCIVGVKVALMHSELSELFESHRLGKYDKPDEHCPEFTNEEVEVADLIIRACDYAGWRGLRVAGALLAKHEYNKKRPYLHNKSC